MAAQQSIPPAVPEPNAATAEGFTRAIVELVIKATVVGAVSAAAEAVIAAMVAESPRQHFRGLPVRLDQETMRRRTDPRACGVDGSRREAGEDGERESSHGFTDVSANGERVARKQYQIAAAAGIIFRVARPGPATAPGRRPPRPRSAAFLPQRQGSRRSAATPSLRKRIRSADVW
jgi:hypothetical protein